MHTLASVWVIGSLALATSIAAEVFAGATAFGTASDRDLVLGLRALLFLALGFSIIGTLSLIYFTFSYPQYIHNRVSPLKHSVWTLYVAGLVTAVVSSIVDGIALIWLILQRANMPASIWHRKPTVWLYIWLGFWGASVCLQVILFLLLARQIRKHFQTCSLNQHIDSFGMMPPSRNELFIDTRGSMGSRDTTLASTPRSPSSTLAGSSIRGPATIQQSVASSRTKLVGKQSTRSSFEPSSPVVGEVLTLDAFERWDTSSVHQEVRAAMGGTSTTNQLVLETIPGSRPESPAYALDGPYHTVPLPIPEASTAALTTSEWDSAILSDRISSNIASAPQSNPPNFSRPTSQNYSGTSSGAVSSGQEGHVHPLFRASSPLPPPIATFGTTVTVSKQTNSPLTPKTLATLRTNSVQERNLRQSMRPTSKGHWRAVPSVDASSIRPSTAGSSVLGSPGPSIADEEELPPILPGFVLGAGSRRSMIGYSSRKTSQKGNRSSRLSFTD